MKTKLQINGEAVPASQEGMLDVELFLQENYLFRNNVLNGKVEFVNKSKDGGQAEFRTLTQQALNSIILRAKREGVGENGSPKTDIMEYINSEEVERFDPVKEYLDGLPAWDGQNHVAKLFSRIPNVSTEQFSFLSIWMRSMVAHWLQMDTQHGNECVPTLIGPQGCGKTTFVRRLLPWELREYYLDHLNLGNKFDKEMALTNNLIVNLDELEAISANQHAKLKQTLSVSKVNGRPIFGRTQEDRPRYASFVATTNNPHPLTDPTGSRRYICIQIPDGLLVNNEGDIDYGQLYAQVVYELRELKSPYWFSNDEVARIQQLNQEFMEQKDLGEMFVACFRQPEEGEVAKTMNCDQMIEMMRKSYPSLPNTVGNKVRLGKTIKALGFKYKEKAHISYYDVIPVRVA